MAYDYLSQFAIRCGYRPDDVFDMPWPALVKLTLDIDDAIEQDRKMAEANGA